MYPQIMERVINAFINRKIGNIYVTGMYVVIMMMLIEQATLLPLAVATICTNATLRAGCVKATEQSSGKLMRSWYRHSPFRQRESSLTKIY